MTIADKILISQMLKASCTEYLGDDIYTSPFCCVTDIPIKDLPNHAEYYGKVAIGFRASSIHASFLPVLYQPTKYLPKIEDGFKGKPVTRWLRDTEDNTELITKIDPALASNPLKNYLKITEFSDKSEESFYQEREWRHAGSNFNFQHYDVAAVVAPSIGLSRLQNLINQSGKYGESLSVVTWEFIENA